MHAVFMTFTTSVPLEELGTSFTTYADELVHTPGLRSKTWIADGSTLGGFHVFDAATDADTFLAGDLFGSIRHNPWFSAFELRRFDVLEDLTALTSGVSAESG